MLQILTHIYPSNKSAFPKPPDGEQASRRGISPAWSPGLSDAWHSRRVRCGLGSQTCGGKSALNTSLAVFRDVATCTHCAVSALASLLAVLLHTAFKADPASHHPWRRWSMKSKYIGKYIWNFSVWTGRRSSELLFIYYFCTQASFVGWRWNVCFRYKRRSPCPGRALVLGKCSHGALSFQCLASVVLVLNTLEMLFLLFLG